MAYGFEVKNDLSEITVSSVDDNGILYFLRPGGEGTLTVDTANSVGDGYYGIETVATNAYATGDAICFARPYIVSGGGVAFSWNAAGFDGTDLRIYSSYNDVFEYKIFDPVSSINPSVLETGYGINTYNSSGDLTYTTNALNAKVIGSIDNASTYTPTSSEVYAYGWPWVSTSSHCHKRLFRSTGYNPSGYTGTMDYYSYGISWYNFGTSTSEVSAFETTYMSFDLSGVGPAPSGDTSTIPTGAINYLLAYL